MKKSFLNWEKPPVTLLFCPQSAEKAIATIQKGMEDGAEAFAIQMEHLCAEDRNATAYRRILAAAGDSPVYVTNYRHHANQDVPEETIAQGLLELADCGATVCDIMGDLFCPTPGEMTTDPAAVEKQMALVEKLHSAGAEVLMSSHIYHYLPQEEVTRLALLQQQRNVDIAKIVTGADSMEQQLDNLATTEYLKNTLKIPFLFLSGGQCRIHRQIGPLMGCCMYLCCLDDTIEPKPVQPMVRKVKAIRDNWY